MTFDLLACFYWNLEYQMNFEFHPFMLTLDLPMLTVGLPFVKMHGSAEISACGRSKVDIFLIYVDL